MLLFSFRIRKAVIILNRSVHVAVHLVLPSSHRVQNLGMIVALKIIVISIYTVSDLGVLSNLIGSLSLANEHYSPPTE